MAILPDVPGELLHSAKKIAGAANQKGKPIMAGIADGAAEGILQAAVIQPVRLMYEVGAKPTAKAVTTAAWAGAKWTLGHTRNALLSLPIVPVWARQSVANGRLTLPSRSDLPPPPPLPGSNDNRSGTGA